MGINLPCGNKPLTTTECGGDCDEKIERLAERVSEAEDKLDTIQEGAEVNVNADWDETDPDSDAYIENKPSVNYDLSLGDSAPTVGSAVVGSAVLGSLVDIILGRGDGTEDRVSVSGTGAIQITRDGDTMTIHVPVGDIDQLRNGTDTEARAWAADVLKQWLDERIAQIPADQFLDLNKTVFANPFSWSSTTYPGSINPNLDGKPVLVLALTDGENVSYSFLNMEDLIDAYEGVAPISVNGSQISHQNSGVTAGQYGDQTNRTPAFGDTFKTLYSHVDAMGHVIDIDDFTVKIPDTLATQESAGLMSAEDKEKLDNVDQLYKTTCGNPIVIDDADGEVKAFNVELTPIQDLHGYDKPWVAGTINKIDTQGLPITITSQTIVGTYFTTKQTTWTASVMCTNNTNIAGAVNLYVYNGNTLTKYKSTAIPVGATNQIISATLDLSTDTITELQLVITGASAGYSITVSGAQINEGQPLDQIYPYENICPIYPHTSLDVRDTGKNLLHGTEYNTTYYNKEIGFDLKVNLGRASYTQTDNTITVTTSDSWQGVLFATDVLKAGSYHLHYNSTSTNLRGTIYEADADYIVTRVIKNFSAGTVTDEDITVTDNKRIAVGICCGSAGTVTLTDLQVEYGTAFTSYAPYTGQTVTVPLNDLYGGLVDVIGGESENTVNNIELTNNISCLLSSQTDDVAVFDAYFISNGWASHSSNPQAISNRFSTETPAGNAGRMVMLDQHLYFVIAKSELSSLTQSGAREWLNDHPTQLCYELATPTPLTTTPTALTLYKGDNVISSDGVMCITYLQDRGDLTDFINEMKECCEEVKGSLLENLVDGSAQGSLRGIDTAQEDANYTIGRDATALGAQTKASGNFSYAGGGGSTASGVGSFAHGANVTASNDYGHAEGNGTTASGKYSHTEGTSTNATAENAHSEGGGTTASAAQAHSEGGGTTASAYNAHSEGSFTEASGVGSHTEGNYTKATVSNAHAEGNYSEATQAQAHAQGDHTKAKGQNSDAEGEYTIASNLDQHVGGAYNVEDTTGTVSTRGTYVEIIGNGVSDSSRSNARTLDWNGNEALQGGLTLGKGTADEVTITAAQLQQLLALI